MKRDIVAEFSKFADRTIAVAPTVLPAGRGLTALFNQKSPFAQDPVYALGDQTKYLRILPEDPNVKEMVDTAQRAGLRVHFDFFMGAGVPDEMPNWNQRDDRCLRIPVRIRDNNTCYISASTRCMIG